MQKARVEKLLNCAQAIECNSVPSLPNTHTTYILRKHKSYNPFESLSLSLERPSTHSGICAYSGKSFRVVSRKCIGCYSCQNRGCSFTQPVSVKKPVCHDHGIIMAREGRRCEFRVYHLKQIDEETDQKIEHIVIANGIHNHYSFPPEWRITQKSREAIREHLTNNPSLTASSPIIKNLQTPLLNSERTNCILTNERKKIYGEDQRVRSI
jgi:hypothetical protein